MLRMLSILKGDCRITCFGTASYWSTEFVPIMNSVQCGKFRTFLGPENTVRATCSEMLRFGSHDRIRHAAVMAKISVSAVFELLVFSIFLMCSFGFPFIFRN